MLGGLGAPELMIILVIVLVLFGGGRVARLGGDLGSGVRAFREGLREDSQQPKEDETVTR